MINIRMARCILLFVALSPAVSITAAQDESKLDPTQPYQAARSNPVTYPFQDWQSLRAGSNIRRHDSGQGPADGE